MQPVLVVRLVTANTIDQRMIERADGKRTLEKMVIHRGIAPAPLLNQSTTSLRVPLPPILLTTTNTPYYYHYDDDDDQLNKQALAAEESGMIRTFF
jgi:hypothetical protein